MSQFRTRSAVEQVVDYLREELYRGAWRGTMPGGDKLAKELAIGRNTVEVALQQLEKEGLLLGQGARRRRIIKLPVNRVRTSLQVAILRFEDTDNSQDSIIEVEHRLSEAGHAPFYPTKTLNDLSMDVKRVARFVKHTEADAWVIVAGSREVLEWFAKRPEPAFALFGRRQNVDIASVGPQTEPTIVSIARRLVELGHHRIVLLSRRDRRLPKPARFERAFLGELEAHGLEVGSYNLPDWEETRQGLHQRLDSLFRFTPPTALIINEPPVFNAVLLYLAGRGIRTPKDVSIVCTDPDRSFNWCEPPVSHITWDISKAASRVVRWAANVNRGKEDRRQTHIKAEFVEGGTIGPAKV